MGLSPRTPESSVWSAGLTRRRRGPPSAVAAIARAISRATPVRPTKAKGGSGIRLVREAGIAGESGFLAGVFESFELWRQTSPIFPGRERMSGTVSRVGCAHSDPLAVLTLLARPVLCAQAVIAFATPWVAVLVL